MADANRKKLIRGSQKIVDDLTITAVFISHFEQEKVFNAYNVEDIMSIKNKYDRNRKFVEVLTTRGPEGYPFFIRILVKESQLELAKTVDPELTAQICKELNI